MKLNQPKGKELVVNTKKDIKLTKQRKGMWGHNSKFIPNTKTSSPSPTYY